MSEQNGRLEIREMKKTDLPEVARIEKENFSIPWSEQGFADSMEQENTCFLSAYKNGSIVGYCGYLQVLDEADITNVSVDAASRRDGVGESMLQELMRRGAQKGIKAFTLEVRESNLAAISLYQKLGFVSAGIRKNFYDAPKENAVIMWKYL